MKAVQIHHFSDILCVWAYVGQVRVDELCRVHGDDIELHYHYVDIFGDVPGRLTDRWSEKGGLPAYSQHVIDVVSGFEHVEVHEEVWKKSVPNSSMSCHQFLHAVRLVAGQDAQVRAAWSLREAFFARAEDVSQRRIQLESAEALGLSVKEIEQEICSGAALARVSRDLKMASEQSITVSPTLVFNEGRQMLKGNVSFRVIEANVSELLSKREASHSWC
jgi:predicted DsbA family dithiol-disulfide isomerase